MQTLVGIQRDAFLQLEIGQCPGLALLFQPQEAGEQLARLEAFGRMKPRRGEAVAVVLTQRVEGVEVAEIEQADAAIVQGVAWRQIPFEQAGQHQRDQQVEQLDQLSLVPALDAPAFDPGRQHDALLQRGVLRRHDAGQAFGLLRCAHQPGQVAAALQLVEETRLAVRVLHTTGPPGDLQRPVAPGQLHAVDPSGQPVVEAGAYPGLVATHRCQLFRWQRAILRAAQAKLGAAGEKGQLGLAPCRCGQGCGTHRACTTMTLSSPSSRAKA